jgi:hypothetical protein
LLQKAEDAFFIEDGISHTVRFGAVGGEVLYSIYALGRHDADASSSSSSSPVTSSSSTIARTSSSVGYSTTTT